MLLLQQRWHVNNPSTVCVLSAVLQDAAKHLGLGVALLSFLNQKRLDDQQRHQQGRLLRKSAAMSATAQRRRSN